MAIAVAPSLLSLLAVLLLSARALDAAEGRPNIVYILTDDQDVRLGSLEAQPVVRSQVAGQGLFFNNAFVTTPVCCPSRSSILTGKYTHNHHTFENTVPTGCDGPAWRELNENKTVGAYMSQAGYNTGFFGKYLNLYALPPSKMTVAHVPPGWSTWYALRGNSVYYDYIMSNNGKAEEHGDNYTLDYLTDRLKEHAVDFIHRAAGKGDAPFFMYIATPAPHRPATPAPQYAHQFDGKPAPHTPSYGHAGTDKHWIVSKGTPPMNTAITKAVDTLYEDRLETLLSVDDLVSEVLKALEEEQVLDNTFVFYNSDHGYHLGQFNQQGEKRQPYEEDIRVPLIVRGPGVVKNASTNALALNIDLTPTFLDLAEWPLPEDMDGESLKSVLLGKEVKREESQFLVEYFGSGDPPSGCFIAGTPTFIHDCWNNTFLAVRSLDTSSEGDNGVIFSEFFQSDAVPLNTSEIYFREYYDISQDPWQLTNQINKLSEAQISSYQALLEEFYTCSGSSCHKLRSASPTSWLLNTCWGANCY